MAGSSARGNPSQTKHVPFLPSTQLDGDFNPVSVRVENDTLVIAVARLSRTIDGAKATLAASGGDRLARGRRHRNIICQTQTLAAQEPDATAVWAPPDRFAA